MKFFIINDFDRPHEKLVMAEYGDCLRYIHAENKECAPLYKPKDATPIEEFGFDVFVSDNVVKFKKARESTATYRDGRPRRWQGSLEFEITL